MTVWDSMNKRLPKLYRRVRKLDAQGHTRPVELLDAIVSHFSSVNSVYCFIYSPKSIYPVFECRPTFDNYVAFFNLATVKTHGGGVAIYDKASGGIGLFVLCEGGQVTGWNRNKEWTTIPIRSQNPNILGALLEDLHCNIKL